MRPEMGEPANQVKLSRQSATRDGRGALQGPGRPALLFGSNIGLPEEMCVTQIPQNLIQVQ